MVLYRPVLQEQLMLSLLNPRFTSDSHSTLRTVVFRVLSTVFSILTFEGEYWTSTIIYYIQIFRALQFILEIHIRESESIRYCFRFRPRTLVLARAERGGESAGIQRPEVFRIRGGLRGWCLLDIEISRGVLLWASFGEGEPLLSGTPLSRVIHRKVDWSPVLSKGLLVSSSCVDIAVGSCGGKWICSEEL